MLEWQGLLNVRDLGGLAAGEGRRTRWGALVRSDLISRLTEAGQAALLDHGVRTIVDLRSSTEVARSWGAYPFRESGVSYVNVPFHGGRDPTDDERIKAAYRSASSRSELTRLDLEWGSSGVAAAAAAIADADPGGVLVHCHAGKDRTGVVVAVLLSLVGVSDDEIANDYALTAVNIEPLIVEWLDSMSQDTDERARLRELAMPAREAMLDTLAYLRQRYGSAERYLRLAGVSDEQLERLRSRLVAGV
jgi:protein tyrosine/serine phosphatase